MNPAFHISEYELARVLLVDQNPASRLTLKTVIRENVRLAPAAPLEENVNAALVQTLSRSLNTSTTVLSSKRATPGEASATTRGARVARIRP